MSPERKVKREESAIRERINGDPFRFPDLFYHSLARIGYPIKFQSGEEPVAVIPIVEVQQIQAIRDGLRTHSISEILDSVGVGGSNEILLLLKGKTEEFYKRYEFSLITTRSPIKMRDLEKLFMRAYKQWFKPSDLYEQLYKHSPFPKPEETAMFERLKKRGVKPATISEMQNLLIPTIRTVAGTG